MLDIKNPDHVAALRWVVVNYDDINGNRDVSIPTHLSGVKGLAFAALSSPALAADLIRQLVERAGAKWYLTTTKLGVAFYRDKPHRREEEEFWFACHELPFLIARLLDIAPNAGAVEVLKALRGEV